MGMVTRDPANSLGDSVSTSIEPIVASWAVEQIGKTSWEHAPEQNGRNLDTRIDEALRQAPSKSGGDGPNKPDHVIIIDTGDRRIPVLCEWKGAKGALRDKKDVSLRAPDGYMRYGNKGIDKYASLGAAYYASRVVGPSGHPLALALAVNGYYLSETDKTPTYEVALYAVERQDTERVVWIGDYQDLSFLDKKNTIDLLQQVEDALNPDAAQKRAQHATKSLDEGLRTLNEFLHSEHGIVPAHRVNVIAALVIASLGVGDDDGNVISSPLTPDDLKGGSGNQSDGAIIFSRVEDYLQSRVPVLPEDKRQSVLNTLRPTLLDSSLSSKTKKGNSTLKQALLVVTHGLLPHYHGDRAIDFTGKLFNEMYAWIDVPDAGANDVVLTPKRTTDLMIELTRVDKDSFVWDWTLGTGAFLVSAMNTMIADARRDLQGEELRGKELRIKTTQLLGIEKLGPIYVLAVLNMILMGDGSTNIIHGDSHSYNGKYQSTGEVFPATTLVLNPPYSAPGNGLIFVKEALDMMVKQGTGKYGAVIIQDSAGSGQAIDYCRHILKTSTLIASIKMPPDLFIGKSGVQTSIYVFEVGTPHHKDRLVKFIDFRDDGYKRSNRRKAKDPLVNLRPIDDPDGRYAEVAAIVVGRRYQTDFYPRGKTFFEDTIDPQAGNDWNFDQHVVLDVTPGEADIERVVSSYISWEISHLLTHGNLPKADALPLPGGATWKKHQISGLFTPSTRGKRLVKDARIPGELPFVTAGEENEGISSWVRNNVEVFPSNTVTIDMFGSAKYRGYQYGADDHIAVVDTSHLDPWAARYLTAAIHKAAQAGGFDYSRNFYAKDADALIVTLPTLPDGKPHWKFMANEARRRSEATLAQVRDFIHCQGWEPMQVSQLHSFKEFPVGELFSIAPTSPFEKASEGSMLAPVVSNTSQNNGVKDYSRLEANNPANIITFSDTTDSVDTVFYQPSGFVGYSHVQAMTPTTYKLNRQTGLFFVTAFKKAIGNRFNWGTKFNRTIAAKTEVLLPVTDTGNIDYDLMESWVLNIGARLVSRLNEYLVN